MSYTQFTLEERKYLQKLLSEGLSLRKAAAVLERSPSSVSREVKRNRSKYRPHRKPDNPYWYNHWRTQILYTQRRRQSVRRAIQPGTESMGIYGDKAQGALVAGSYLRTKKTDTSERRAAALLHDLSLHCKGVFPSNIKKNELSAAWKTDPDKKCKLQHHTAGSDHPRMAGVDH